jgi:hypothetical protein
MKFGDLNRKPTSCFHVSIQHSPHQRKKANRMGLMTNFLVSLISRAAGGEPLFGIPVLFHHPEWRPVRTDAAIDGLKLLPQVSRLFHSDHARET